MADTKDFGNQRSVCGFLEVILYWKVYRGGASIWAWMVGVISQKEF